MAPPLQTSLAEPSAQGVSQKWVRVMYLILVYYNIVFTEIFLFAEEPLEIAGQIHSLSLSFTIFLLHHNNNLPESQIASLWCDNDMISDIIWRHNSPV